MKKLHLTTQPRLAMKRNEAGELVPNINEVTGEQDVNIAGTLVSINPEPITYTRKEDGTEGIAYRGRTLIADENGEESEVPVLINEASIEHVTVGQTYWVNERDNAPYAPNYSQGHLPVSSVSAETASVRRARLLAQQAKAEEVANAEAEASTEEA